MAEIMENLNEHELLLNKFESFCKINEQFRLAFKVTEGNSKLNKAQKIDLHLYYLSRNIFPVKLYFKDVVDHFPEFLPKLITIAVSFDDKNDSFDYDQHIINCVLLGNLIKVRSDLGSYACKYFEKNPSPFIDEDSSSKKRKMSQNVTVSDLDLVESCYILLKSDSNFYMKKWQWSEFADKYLDHEAEEVRWIACHCISIVTRMSEKQLKKLFTSKLPLETHERLSCVYNFNSTLGKNEKAAVALDQHPCIAVDKKINSEVVEIAGIYIPKLPCFTSSDEKKLVIVNSTYNNLRKIALGLSSNQAICLQGPVGSGKTCLVEYLASKTGRKLGENFIKVQLGDQTDSKMLLGTYRCTDIPGEFIWQPGVLTQAVIEGQWLLLEDIDSASMDIASVLSGLLENGSLSVPGYRDSLSASPGFQLFATQRLVSTITGHHKKHSGAMTLLDKHLLQINVDPLTSDELKEILTTYHPEFTTIAERMLRVFHLFTRHDLQEIAMPKTTRSISTRDFFKWCSRAAVDFDISSQASALKVLQDAIDVFCCSFPRAEDALNLAKEISTHLGIVNQKAEFFFATYKPNMRLTATALEVGRASLPRNNESFLSAHRNYYFTRPSSVLLERIMCCVNRKEPVLLVGETGTGKTSSVQYLADAVGQKLVVINMNQQSDSADLLGGFKPVDLRVVVGPIREEYEAVFRDYFQVEPNRTFLGHVAFCFEERRWSDLVALMTHTYEAAIARLTRPRSDEAMLQRWRRVGEKLRKLSLQLKQRAALAFSFVEGSLVRAVERGHWVLLDEINLANAETLECLSGLLEGADGSLCLLERGDREPVRRDSHFTLFACMNPSTDVGKKDLPAGLRNRFTEFFVDELTERSDLLLLVDSYLDALCLKSGELERIVDFYLKVRKEAETGLTDGLGHRPHFSLRSLCRALRITAKNPCGTVKKSMYEAFCLSFLTQLDPGSYSLVERMIARYLVGDEKALKAVKNQPIPEPKGDSDGYLQFEGYWIRRGGLECAVPEDYVLTESVRKNLKDLVRIVSIGRLPVLLQGDTSVGKTSLITYLARASGNKCVRINNHEHTDLQEYIGSYVADYDGKLVFREGLLVEAMRRGHWIILDELNLAPSDVLEALNRVLDDNRELFIPETQETVRADPNFMLFATQNPPGSYGGRKMLSRAFRNRFVELHFDEIPPVELEFILHKRCRMSPSYAKKMIGVMTDLQMRRRGSAAFAGKKGFITLRDLFRWGERYRLAQHSQKLYDWDQHLADEGYLVLAGRVRKSEEKREIVEVLQKHLKREVNPWNLFTLSDDTSPVTKDVLVKIDESRRRYPNIVWTYNMRQLAVLVAKAFRFKEPVLLVGETGGGKTTVCKLIAELDGRELLSVNCHMHTESGDFIGGLRPIRDHVEDEVGKLFEWVDGPLIRAMTQGSVFLADEISLADDSVLERLNSLLEPERTLLLAEKGVDLTDNTELVVAEEGFHFIGTMNPGGDFGKKELSPALRNRFTEIWCETCSDRDDLIAIVESNIRSGICLGNQEDGSSGLGKRMMEFVDWFKSTEIGKRCTVSIRDILTWVGFVNNCAEKISVYDAYLHGVYLTFLDGLGSGVTGTENLHSVNKFKRECEEFIVKQLRGLTSTERGIDLENLIVEQTDHSFGVKPFYIELGTEDDDPHDFSFNAPTTLYNTLRLLRGMQLNKAILLEGSPGVGKTSLVTALAKLSRHKVFRVNLSDQTDISDLFGADLPVEGGTGGQFSWRDGPLLQALKRGHWILLDELNLASQSVLEGLNACLDHRGEIFVPELGKTFHVEPGTRFFACQNPLKQGGSRRGLPRSFLNRFIQVHVGSLTDEDLAVILQDRFPSLGSEMLDKMLKFNSRVVSELDDHNFGNRGAPWEFNLRDLTRWCEATIYHHGADASVDKRHRPESLVQLIYSDRMRTLRDKIAIEEIFRDVFGCGISGDAPVLYVNEDRVCVGDVSLERSVNETSAARDHLVLRSQLGTLRSLAYCVNLNWMSLLVGGSGSGKSSVVRVLASLAGKTLRTLSVTSAMDTTDILGGFEQTDYARHLEEVVRETERLVLKTARSLLVKDRQWTGLLRLWEAYSTLDSDVKTKRSMEEETQLFLEKLEALEMIFASLLSIEECRGKATVEDLGRRVDKIRRSVTEEGSLNSGGKFEWVDSVLIKCLRDGCWLLVDNVNLCSAAVLDRLNALLEPKGVLTVSERGVDEVGGMVEISPHPEFRLFLSMDPKNGEISRAMRNRGVEIYILTDKERGERNELDVKSLICRQGLTESGHIDLLLNLHDLISDLLLGEKPNVNELLRAAALISRQILHGTDESRAFLDAVTEVYYKTRTPTEFSCNDFRTVIRTEIEKSSDRSPERFADSVTLRTARLHVCSTLEKIGQQAAVLDDRSTHSLIHFFGVGSGEELRVRARYLAGVSNDALCLQVSEALREFLAERSIGPRDFPLDGGWIPETNYEGKNRAVGNAAILGMHVIAGLEKERSRGRRGFSLLEYMEERRLDRVDDRFDDVLVDKFLDLIEEYNSFLLDNVKGDAVLTDNELIEILELTSWRFVFYAYTSVSVSEKTDARQRHLVLTNLRVHYRWFFKYSVQRIRELFGKSLPRKLEGLIEAINADLEEEFSSLHKLGKRFQKLVDKPPPRVSSAEIELSRRLDERLKMLDPCDRNNDPMKVFNVFRNDPTLRTELINLRLDGGESIDDKIDLLKSIGDLDDAQFSEYESQLFPVLDYFVLLQARRAVMGLVTEGSGEEITPYLTLPIGLERSLSLYVKSGDKRLVHELTAAFFEYQTRAVCLVRGPAILSGFSPVLTYHLTNLLVTRTGEAVTTFGNFRQLTRQHRRLNTALWFNFRQLQDPSYDYLSSQRRFVVSTFELFVRTLAEALSVEETDWDRLIQVCSARSGDLSTRLSECAADCADLKIGSEGLEGSLSRLYKIHMELSYSKAVLNARLPPIDPSAKKALKKKYCAESVRNFEDLRDSFVDANRVYSGNDKSLHPHHRSVTEMLESLKRRDQKLGSYVAVRPGDVLYDEVVKAVNHGFSTILSRQYIDRIISSLDKSIRDLITADSSFCDESSESVSKQYEVAVSSFENLICEWSKYRASYPDVIEPVLSNVSEFLFGLKSNLALLRKLQLRHAYKKFDVQRALVTLIQMPSLGPNNIRYELSIEICSNPDLHGFINDVLKNDEFPNAAKQAILRLLKCGIQESFNNCILETRAVGLVHFAQFDRFVRAFVEAWNEQERQREMEEKEAGSLYKIKTKCDEDSESEQISQELKELFPNYHDEDFADMRKLTSLSDDPEPRSMDNKFAGVISNDDVKFVVDLHVSLLQSTTKTEWLNPEKNKNVVPDFVNPLMEKYKVFKQMSDKIVACLDYRMDRELVESLSVLLAFVQNYGNVDSDDHPSPSRRKRDFYKDANVEEVKSSFHILEELRSRVSELLAEWPDHPTLQTIREVIARIYNFDISSPVSRFLQGFEILLGKCNEWEEVAHSGVSLSGHSRNLAQQIIAWRRMELNVWRDLLEATFDRLNEPMYKWWLYLYNVMEEFTREGKFGEVELIETLQDYVTKSNLAEFENRLTLLRVFHCHVVHNERSERADAFVNVLWNLYNYFRQFSASVANKIKELKAPIEKKLREYVKIVRWKDINYWAIKETVDKSHKTLHKFVREYQEVLRQPVVRYLVNASSSSKVENVGIWDRPQRHLVKTFHYTLDPATYVAKESFKKKLSSKTSTCHGVLVSKIDSCFVEARKLCKETITEMQYARMIQNLDNFVTQIIETSSHLQGLEVDTTLSKEKQKSLARSILHQKHRALADLFKTLSRIGLSFKSGIVEAKLKLATENFTLKPIDIRANFGHINYNRKDEKILTIWDGCEMHYLKSLMRADVLDAALKTPAPDLGLPNVERCRGFSANLLTLAQRQKRHLTEASNMFYYLRHYTTQLTRVCEARSFLSLRLVEETQTLTKNVTVVLKQARIVLSTCPEEEASEEVVVLRPESRLLHKNDPSWSRVVDLIGEALALASKVDADLEKCKGEIPGTVLKVIRLQFVPVADSIALESKLEDIRRNLEEIAVVLGKCKLSDGCSWLGSEIARLTTELNGRSVEEEFDEETAVGRLVKLADAITDEISTVVQKLHRKYSVKTGESAARDDGEEIQIEENHLKVAIVENLESDFRDLGIAEILNHVQEVAEIFFALPPDRLGEARDIVSYVLPLLEQIILYHQYFLTQQVSAYRVTSKMNSVLLNIFIELASKGFCVPPELTEEDGEGVGKPSDGLGLGEGKGEKDVSDKIESEDQLDDAQPEGQEKSQEEDEDCREEDKGIEMSEDFDSKLQDVDRKEDDEQQDDSESDGEEQMGETEKDANKQDKKTFGSEDEDEDGDDQKEEKEERGESGEKQGEQEMGAKEKDGSKNDENPGDDDGKEKEEKKKEINEMEEPEIDDDQTDPYHGKQAELPEPEPMDLPDDLQLDEGQEQDNENDEGENPFDIDAMKEDNPFENKNDEENENQKDEENDEAKDFSSDDEDIRKEQDGEENEDDKVKDEERNETTEKRDEGDAEENEEMKESEESGLDQTQTKEDNVEAMEVEHADASDKTQANQDLNQKSNQPIEELCQEDKPDKEGVGQSQMEESTTGHSAQTTAPQEIQSAKRPREEEEKKKQKPGDSDSKRSLGDVKEPVKKKLKTVDPKQEDREDGRENDEDARDEEAEMYKHIKEAKENTTQTLDVATEEQAESQKNEVPNLEEEEETGEEPTESSDRLPEEEEEKIEEASDVPVQKPETSDSKKSKNDKKQHPEGDVLEEIKEVEVEGEMVETVGVQRGADTTHHTLYEELRESSARRLTVAETDSLRSEVEQQLSAWTEAPSDLEADRAWQKISSVTASLAQDLSEQLRLVLEPTQASRLKGDFRTGRRINMRKVIPYIASQFRKDKIWLRRTKPSKREYQIVLAIDDSSSMADNHSRELAFESVALISKALSLLESGQLSVLSFGEKTEILHKLVDQFTERSGVKLLQKFKFGQSKTCVAQLVDFATEMFAQAQSQSAAALNAKLLVVVSDGRGVFSEGESVVRQAVRRARLAGIFMVFVIVDSPENKNSVLDIRMPVFKDGKLMGIRNYMDVFPFSFYIILRDINSLPSVLSDALRQWFEVVSNLDKQ